ncbi:MAG: DNA translocase FtsK [Clostridia bacterium]|nr:DNA translocase FtsK [Clostridia bacterium]
MKDQKGNSSVKGRTSKPENKKSAFVKALNKLMPYILSVLSAVIIFSLTGLAGGIGEFVRISLYGAFANFATYFLPIFLIYHAMMWNYDIKRGICVRRVVCSIITLICFSTMQYLIDVESFEKLREYNVLVFFNLGKESHGGGFVGGIVGRLVLELGSTIGVVVVTLILVFMILQMFNFTPAYMVRSMFKGKKKKAKAPKIPKPEQRQESRKEPKREKPKPIKPSRIEVFEDEDDAIELETNPYIDNTAVVNLDEVDISGAEDGYEELDAKAIKEDDYIPSQFQPYDEEEEIIKQELDEAPTFEFTSSKMSDEDEDDFKEKIYPDCAETEEDSYEEYSYGDEGVEEGAEDEDASEEDYGEYGETQAESYPEDKDMGDTYSDYVPASLIEKVATKHVEVKLEVKSKPVTEKEENKAPEKKRIPKPKVEYKLPQLYLLHSQPDISDTDEVRRELQENARVIVETLSEFKAHSRIVEITRGPTITRYELVPEPGVRVRTIGGLVDDIALKLGAKGIRIECPIPGKNAIGIEVPNRRISFVYLKDLIDDDRFRNAKSRLTCALGKTISGEHMYVDIESTPHLLVAGATGMGKSVCINSLLISLLYNATPDDVRLILIDPKRVELSNYNGIPHLLVPVVCEPKKSLGALQWAVSEMEQRFIDIESAGVRNIQEFNSRVDKGYDAEKMSRIVIVIDELADLKMAVPDIEESITRLTQKARAAGIHVIIGTQRPSVDVLTGLIKNNIPSRIAFRVPSQIDSRTILDEIGAEKLVSKGDMLVKLTGALAPVRVQGAYVSVDEIQDVIDFWKENGSANYDEAVMQQIDNNAAKLAKAEKEFDDSEGSDADSSEFDPEFYNALAMAVDAGRISSSLIMRKLSLGFQRASRIIDQMEECGYIGEANGSKPRDVLITKEDFQELMMRKSDEDNN